MTQKFVAEIQPLNAAKIGTSAHGTATFTLTAETLDIQIEMFDTPANTNHWEHFHGFPDGQDAAVATAAQDVNGDGFVDLPETGSVSGTTMVPFDDAPQDLNIPHDNYPTADSQGHFAYEQRVPLAALQAKFKAAFGTEDLDLAKRVVYIHGVPDSLDLPASVGGAVAGYDAHTTLPIAAGKIKAVD